VIRRGLFEMSAEVLVSSAAAGLVWPAQSPRSSADPNPLRPLRGAGLGPRLVHTPSEPSGSQRSPAVSSGRSFAQVAGSILRKQARGQNPDKDEVGGSSPPRPTKWPPTSKNAGQPHVQA
jgi:hypothetical protein